MTYANTAVTAPAAAVSAMTTRKVLALMLVLALTAGIVGTGMLDNAARMRWGVAFQVAFSFLGFYWYRLDSEARCYRRTRLLNVAVVAFGVIAIPYYLVRSRSKGAKARSLLRCLGFCVALLSVSVLGTLLGLLST